MPAHPHLQQPLGALEQAYERIDARLSGYVQQLKDDPLQFRKVSRLREMQTAIDRELAVGYRTIPRARMLAVESSRLGYEVGQRFAGVQSTDFALWNKGAADRVANGLYRDLLAANDMTGHTARRLIQEVGRDETLMRLVAGGNAAEASRRMTDVLQRTGGIYGVTYQNGTRMPVGAYSKMAVRTVTGSAYNEATIDAGVKAGTEWFECFDGPDCGLESHTDTVIAAGLVLSAKEAASYPLAHPNCRRAWGPRPDITSEDEAANAARSDTYDQRMDQIAADLNRGQPIDLDRAVPAASQQHRGRPDRADPHGHRAARAAAQRAVADDPRLRTYRDFGGGSEDEMREWGTEKFRPWSESLGTDARHEVADYTGAGYYRMNHNLRTDSPLTDAQARQARSLNESLVTNRHARLPEDVVLHRGTDSDWTDMMKRFDSGQLKPGDVIQDKGFMSTSLNPTVSEDFTARNGIGFRIQAPAGSEGAYLGELSKFGHLEYEVLLPAGSRLEVLSTAFEEGRYGKTKREVVFQLLPREAPPGTV